MTGTSLRVLMYHRVVEPRAACGDNPSVISSTPAMFAQQMRHLAKRCRVVAAEEVLSAVRESRPLPDRAVLITFDDGYRDFAEIAWPILRRYQLPATLFVPTAYPDHPEREFWWDRLARACLFTSELQLDYTPCGRLSLRTPKERLASLRALRKALKTVAHAEAMRLADEIFRRLGEDSAKPGKVLTWHELRELAKEGLTVAAHTRTHPALTRLPLEQARAEVRESREDLLRELGAVTPIFSYPYGDYNDHIVDIVREEGFELAFTCLQGDNPLPGLDPLRMRRTNITSRTGPLLFRVRLTKYGSHVDQWRLAAKAWRTPGKPTPEMAV